MSGFTKFTASALLAALLVGCGGGPSDDPAARGAEPTHQGSHAMSMTLKSPAFEQGQPIPTRYTGEGENISPPLEWSNLPDGTAELAMIVDDPDAPRPQPWVHWVIYKIPGDATGLPQDVPKAARPPQPAGAIQGVNSSGPGNLGYQGPMPPPGHGVHHYHFTLYALDEPLDLQPGLEKTDLLQAMQGHILGQTELIGTYERPRR